MKIRQLLQHWQQSSWQTRRCFNPETLRAIEQAITESEKLHRGELRFVIEGRYSLGQLLRELKPRQRAAELFAEQGVGHTAEHSGILIYVLLAEHQVEILADHGITAKVGQAEWDALCCRMTADFAAGHYRHGALAGIAGANQLLNQHFPAWQANPNELDDAPLVI